MSQLYNLYINGHCMTHPLMQVIICAKYGKDPSRTTDSVERTWQVVPYFSSFIAKLWLNDLGDIGQGQRSLCITHSLMLGIICAKYGKNPSRTVCAVERTQDWQFYCKIMAEWPWRYRSRSKAIMRDTPHAGDHLCLIWKGATERTRHAGRTDRRTHPHP